MNHWRGIDRQVGEHRISFYLFSSAPPRLCATTALNGTLPKSSASSVDSLPATHFIRYPYAGAQKHLCTVVLRQVSQLSAPYYFYTFNFPTPATLVPPHYSLCSFFLEQSDGRLHLRNFPLRYSPYAVQLSPVPLAPFSSLRSPARPMAAACQVSGASNLSSLRISC